MRLFPKRYHPPGTPPGTLKTRTDVVVKPLQMAVYDYADAQLQKLENPSLTDIEACISRDSNTWIRIEGHPNAQWMADFGRTLKLHPLAQEDVLNGGQRPKLEPYEDGQIFLVLNVLHRSSADTIEIGQLSVFWNRGYLVTFHTGRSELFDSVVKRLQNGITRVRRRGLDYLLYSLIDAAIDESFPVLEDLGLAIEDLEDQVAQDPDQTTIESIHHIKRQIVLIRRAVWPQRDVINQLLRDEEEWFDPATRPYLRDCYDHTIQIMDLIESYREMGAALLDVYLSSVSMRMNDIMRVLTIIATIFIPLTFVAGIYGMNFGNNSQSPWAMPELRWYWGYPMVWLLCIVIAVVMVIWFRRKNWL